MVGGVFGTTDLRNEQGETIVNDFSFLSFLFSVVIMGDWYREGKGIGNGIQAFLIGVFIIGFKGNGMGMGWRGRGMEMEMGMGGVGDMRHWNNDV